jgi:phage shock protein C
MQAALSASQDAEIAVQDAPVLQDEQQNLFLRNDTIFGICEGIGQDFGFNANYLRVVLCSLLYFNPVAVIGGYFALGAAVALSRWLYPVPRSAQSPQLAAPTEAHSLADNEDEDSEALAA